MNLCKAVTDVRTISASMPPDKMVLNTIVALQPIGTVHRPISITAFLVG